MDSAFMNIVRGNRLQSVLGLRMEEGVPFRWGKDYAYVEVPLHEIYHPVEETVVAAAKRMQTVKLLPACRVEPKMDTPISRIIVTVNPLIHEVCQAPTMFMLEPSDRGQPGFYVTMRKDSDFAELKLGGSSGWLVRLYLMS